MKRRKFLALIGGGLVLAAGGGLATVASRTPSAALEPWKLAGTPYSEPRMRALSYAILSPNPHNRQPWLADLSDDQTIRLYVDLERLLPHTDPFNRQITVGLGCFLETLRLAALKDGFRADISLFPEGSDETALDQRPVAEIKFVEDPSQAPDPLFDHILVRRTIKEPYDLKREIPQSAIMALESSSFHETTLKGSVDPTQVSKLRTITAQALEIEMNTPRTYLESVDLMRIGKKEIEANPDGIDFSGPLFETLHATGLINREGLADTSSAMFQQGMDAVLTNANTAMGHIWQITRSNRREDQVAAGQDWMRLHLTATAQGIALQPLSQALQEFPEMNALYTDVHKMLAPSGGTLQMLARLGYADTVPPSPRWPLEAKLIKG